MCLTELNEDFFHHTHTHTNLIFANHAVMVMQPLQVNWSD